MSELEVTQQEIASINVIGNDIVTQPVEKLKKKRTAFFYKLQGNKNIAYLATLVALSVFFKILSLNLSGIKVTFFYLPIFLSGALFGPLYGLAVGIIGEVLGGFYLYGSSFNPFILAGNSLMGFIVGLVFRTELPSSVKFIISASLVCLICTLGVNTYGLSWFYGMPYTVQLLAGTPLPRVVMQPLIIAVNTALVVPIYYALNKFLSNKTT